jgi:hypothetical protein
LLEPFSKFLNLFPFSTLFSSLPIPFSFQPLTQFSLQLLAGRDPLLLRSSPASRASRPSHAPGPAGPAAVAASPLRLLPYLRSMTGGDHLSSPTRCVSWPDSRSSPTRRRARSPGCPGPHAKAVHTAFISRTATPWDPHPCPSRPEPLCTAAARNPNSPPLRFPRRRRLTAIEESSRSCARR